MKFKEVIGDQWNIYCKYVLVKLILKVKHNEI